MVGRALRAHSNCSGQRSAARVSRRPAPSTQRPFARVKVGMLNMVFQGLRTKCQIPKLVTAPRPRWVTRSNYASLGQGADLRVGEDHTTEVLRASGGTDAPLHMGVGMPASRRQFYNSLTEHPRRGWYQNGYRPRLFYCAQKPATSRREEGLWQLLGIEKQRRT
jgi:hypothetical protein